MRIRLSKGLAACAVLAALAACSSTPSKSYNATVFYVIDDGTSSAMDPKLVEQHKQVADRMRTDMATRMSRYNVTASALTGVNSFSAAGNNHLLQVKLTSYDPGIKALRMMVGFGAGSANMSYSYELSKQKGQAITRGDLSVRSGRDWMFCVDKLNDDVIKAILPSLPEGAAAAK